MTDFLMVKLRRPVPPPKRIVRPVLTQRLNEGIEQSRPIMLVSAPAGFGKTTAVSDWLENLRLPAAWLSLDVDDNEPGRFFSYLTAALIKIEEAVGHEVFSRLREVDRVIRSGQAPPVDVIASALIADTAGSPERFLLVLDDFHLIHERAILTIFEKLIASLFQPGITQPLSLVLLTREDPLLPLARLRANNQLAEIRADDLRLRRDEVGRFLSEVIGLNLSEADIFALEDRTEGWIAGLQLAGLSIRGQPNASRFIRNLSGSHRFILSYLTEEVLSRQPEDVQQFMLETSILDRLCGELCCAVTGRSGSRTLLEQLWTANLFLIPLDDEQRWYRYHHLFADLLRSRLAALQGVKMAALHHRASRWFTQASEAAPSPIDRTGLASEAIRHALAAGRYSAEHYPEAVRLIETHVMDFLHQWHTKAVSAWMQALPPDKDLQSPRISLAFARIHLMQADFPQAAPFLEQLQQQFSAESGAEITPGLQSEWLALQSTLMNAQRRPAEALDLARQALALAPKQDDIAQSQANLALAVACQQVDDLTGAAGAYRRLIQVGRGSGDLVTELLGLSALSLMLIQQGRLREGFALAQEGADRLERSDMLPPICAGLYGELGVVYAHWNQLAQAGKYLQRAAQVSALGGSDAEVYFAVFRSRLCLIRGDFVEAAHEIQKAAEVMQADAASIVMEEAVAQQVQVALAQDNLPAAELALAAVLGSEMFPEIRPGQRITYPQGVLLISGLRILLHRGRVMDDQASLSMGIERADQLLAQLRQRGFVPLALEVLLVKAQMHAARGDSQASLANYSAALELAAPEGYLTPFVVEGQTAAEGLAQLLHRSQPGSSQAQFIQKVLEAFPPLRQKLSTQDAARGNIPEPLTARELEVLHLMTGGKTYEEIAGELVVSINTVRTHVKAIYGKLGVSNRTAAIESARRLSIL